MVVISKTQLTDFSRKHVDAVDAVIDWWQKAKEADWGSFGDIKETFNSVDYVGNDRSCSTSKERNTGLWQ